MEEENYLPNILVLMFIFTHMKLYDCYNVINAEYLVEPKQCIMTNSRGCDNICMRFNLILKVLFKC